MLNFYLLGKRSAMLLLGSLLTISGFADTYVVTNTNSSGAGSLAQAITDANDHPGADIITFNLPTDQPCIISLSAPLPVINDALTIDGYSQPGASQGTIAARVIRVNIDGTGVGFNDIFVISHDDVSISGLAVYKGPFYAIRISNTGIDNVHIWGNYIGTDSTGTNAGLGNVSGGIIANYDFTNANPASSNIVVGTNGDGTNDANEGNLIVGSTSTSGSDGDGVLFWKSFNSRISGNIIGLNKNGTGVGFGHSRDGVVVTVGATSTVIGTDGNGTSDALEGNIISNNMGRGILLAAGSSGNVIAGNTIGLDANFALAGNAKEGIEIVNSSNNRIGTDGFGLNNNLESNYVGGNTGSGIRLTISAFFGFESATNGNTIAGNYIGTDATGTLARGNGSNGISINPNYFQYSINNNIIGSNYDGVGDAAEGNVIAYNFSKGIQAIVPQPGSTATGNKFARNSIFSNGLLGIDLNDDGVTANDDGDGDVGINDLLNAPVITSVQVNGTDLIVSGFTRPGTVVEFYIPDAGPNPSPLPAGYTKSFGEGQTFLFRAQDDATLDGIADEEMGTTGTYDGTEEGTGFAGTITESRFKFRIPIASLPVAVTPGVSISSLAYVNVSGAGSTSEFGGVASITVTPVNLLSFKGLLQDNKAYLTWVTAQEYNNSHFDIEKSTNGTDFTKIGTENAKGGWYNNQYNFVDNNVQDKVNYYRLKQVDIDGRATYSKILTIRADLGNFAVKVGPNPFAGNINVLYKLDKESLVQVRLYDQGGRIVKQYTTSGGAGSNTFNISDLSTLPKGQYTLELKGDGIQYRQQVLKQ